MSTELAAPTITPEQMDLVRRTVANGATDAELKLFVYDCARRGIHPLDRLLHFTKRGGKYTPVTSIDFMRAQAAMTGEMAGSDDPIFAEGDKHPLAATVTVYRITQGQRFAYAATARWEEYCPESAPMWKRMPHTMLGKCAEALALRKAFPQQLAGLYSREEMEQAETPSGYTATATHSVAGLKEGITPPGGRIAPPAAAPEAAKVAESRAIGESATEPFIDVQTGEELPPAPAGYHYVQHYDLQGEWHEANLLAYDAQGGAMHISTKRESIGRLLAEAERERVPVKVDLTQKRNSPGAAYVNKVELWKPALTDAALDAEIAKREMALAAGEVL